MTTTPNKGYAVQNTGDNSGTWGSILNDDMISVVDNNLGGIVTKSVAGSNITLTSDESQNVVIRLTGAQSADIQVTNPCIGFYFVENLTTNAFAITMTNGVTGVVVPKGRSTVIADETNGCRIASSDSIPSGTAMLFKQTSAPTGWSKVTADDNKAIRIVSGSVSTGGTLPFTTAFAASRPPTGSTGSYTLTVNDIPSHAHFEFATDFYTASGTNLLTSLKQVSQSANNTGGSGQSGYVLAPTDTAATVGKSSVTGGGGSHLHGVGTLATQMDVQYVDVICATRD